VANAALGGEGVIDGATAYTALPLFDGTGWSAEVAAAAGLDDVARLARIAGGSGPVGAVAAAGGAALGAGTIDAFAEQLVAGADRDGDVLVILGTTLIVWILTDGWPEVEGLWTTPYTVPGLSVVGGPSNAGGFFVNWVAETVGADPYAPSAPAGDPRRVPVWLPYIRGERVPYHDRARRASLHDVEVGLGPDSLTRAAHEASSFVVRHLIDRSGLDPTRVVATGGGVRNPAWLQALADGTRLPVDVVAVPEGGALGAAWLARQAAGLERPGASAAGWVRHTGRYEPDVAWVEPVEQRYRRFRELSG
jgi:xylulokinase